MCVNIYAFYDQWTQRFSFNLSVKKMPLCFKVDPSKYVLASFFFFFFCVEILLPGNYLSTIQCKLWLKTVPEVFFNNHKRSENSTKRKILPVCPEASRARRFGMQTYPRCDVHGDAHANQKLHWPLLSHRLSFASWAPDRSRVQDIRRSMAKWAELIRTSG